MKEEFFEFRLPGQYRKDIESARKIADKEYTKKYKKLYGKEPELYVVNNEEKFLKVIRIAMKKHPQITVTPDIMRKIVDDLYLKKQIDPTLARDIKRMKDSELKGMIKEL